MTFRRFPPGFLWGVATSAYQVEGGVDEEGRGPSIWDRFSHTPGQVANGDTGDVSADHFHRWAEDVAIMADLGLTAYRFSIAWPRVMPTGRGPVNRPGLAFYDRLVDALLERGIAPCPTLYHWDLPATLDDEGGWLARATAERFGDFAAACFGALGDRVRTWFTVNEPWVAATLGYRLGIHAPGRRDLGEALRASHHMLLGHGRAVAAYRAAGAAGGGRIGPVLNVLPTEPATAGEADRDAAIGSDGYTNRWFLDPILRGRYPADTWSLFERLAGRLDWLEPGDLEAIGAPIDLLGVNYYARRRVMATPSDGDGDGAAAGGVPLPWTVVPPPADARRTDAGWEIVPASLTALLTRLRDDYGDVPLLVTENGAVYLDAPRPDGRITDAGRIAFLREHLLAAHRAIDAGVRLEGWFTWSLLDNFEWSDGYRPRYGIVHVDYPTGRRLVKDSGRWYAGVIAANGLDDAVAVPPATVEDRPHGGRSTGAAAGAADVG